LVARFGEIENRQPGMAEPDRVVRRVPFPLAVRSAMSEPREKVRGIRESRLGFKDTKDAAHLC
jgi:hypothetical protein